MPTPAGLTIRIRNSPDERVATLDLPFNIEAGYLVALVVLTWLFNNRSSLSLAIWTSKD
jgi:hypothetical protein